MVTGWLSTVFQSVFQQSLDPSTVTSPEPFPLQLQQSLTPHVGDTRVKSEGLVSWALQSKENMFRSDSDSRPFRCQWHVDPTFSKGIPMSKAD